ncbi:hypothetical protein HAX54_015685 [Datura stramonium]|uniref:Uncharacterized protein n=1 Tax=Datura stramonium TaxID=4076 RepID=A0ABS8TTD5_DATST|nr:hypothetical protein [Datura stramonium]
MDENRGSSKDSSSSAAYNVLAENVNQMEYKQSGPHGAQASTSQNIGSVGSQGSTSQGNQLPSQMPCIFSQDQYAPILQLLSNTQKTSVANTVGLSNALLAMNDLHT